MYVVQFLHWGKSPKEEYYYHNLEDAKAHFDLFDASDGDLYKAIKVIDDETNNVIAYKRYKQIYNGDFAMDEWREKQWIISSGLQSKKFMI